MQIHSDKISVILTKYLLYSIISALAACPPHLVVPFTMNSLLLSGLGRRLLLAAALLLLIWTLFYWAVH